MLLSQYLSRLQNSHLYQHQTNDCGPYCAAIVLDTLGQKIDPKKISETLNTIRWRGVIPIIRRAPNWATFPWGMTDIFKDYGYQAQCHFFSSRRFLIRNLEDATILIIITGGYHPLWAHYSILVAYHSINGWGFIDPGYPYPSIQWISETKFQKDWCMFGNMVITIKPNKSRAGDVVNL